ncbi:MAG TPA: signal peptidase I [Jiangellales bacterium]|nr:signal peptidase I [Jiangellales bacterium]
MLTLAAALALLLGLLVLGPGVYAVDSPSMSPLARPGDRLLTVRAAPQDVRRGDVLVVDAAGTWDPPGSGDAAYVKRVVGLPGERVTCCDAAGRLTVDGTLLVEPYLPPGEAPSSVRFDVVVPPAAVWLLGDSRSGSRDSRDHLGAPGGGSVPLSAVRGRVVAVLWPPQRASAVESPSAR